MNENIYNSYEISITVFIMLTPKTGLADQLSAFFTDNVPRIDEVGQRPIWVKQSGSAYQLLDEE